MPLGVLRYAVAAARERQASRRHTGSVAGETSVVRQTPRHDASIADICREYYTKRRIKYVTMRHEFNAHPLRRTNG